jgi:hypothetical protein
MNDYDRSPPCHVCRSTQPRGCGFCCDSCHASYMSQQHDRWNQPGTATSSRAEEQDLFQRWGLSSRVSVFAHAQPRAARPDPRLEGDEQGWWSNGVRAMEESD